MGLVLGLIIVVVLCFIAVLLLHWTKSNFPPKKVIMIVAFLASCVLGIIYFIYNKDKFPKPIDKIGYFVGVCFSPPGAVEILM